MHRILILPDILPAGYPSHPKAGYPISGRIPVFGLATTLTVEYQIKSSTSLALKISLFQTSCNTFSGDIRH
jgi:hypothetical protein